MPRTTILSPLLVSMLLTACPAARPLVVKPTPTSPAGPPMSAVPDWGIEIAMPAGAHATHEAAAERHIVNLGDCSAASEDELAPSSCATAYFAKRHGPAPPTLEAASSKWDGDMKSASGSGERVVPPIEQGITPNGAFYTVRSFQVRAGFRDSLGNNVHTFKSIARVLAVLPIDDVTHVECTGYIEHGVSSVDDPEMKAVRDVCVSMRRAP